MEEGWGHSPMEGSWESVSAASGGIADLDSLQVMDGLEDGLEMGSTAGSDFIREALEADAQGRFHRSASKQSLASAAVAAALAVEHAAHSAHGSSGGSSGGAASSGAAPMALPMLPTPGLFPPPPPPLPAPPPPPPSTPPLPAALASRATSASRPPLARSPARPPTRPPPDLQTSNFAGGRRGGSQREKGKKAPKARPKPELPQASGGAGRKRPRDKDKEQRAQEARDRNREHARNTRLRKKKYIEELQRTLAELSADNAKSSELQEAAETEVAVMTQRSCSIVTQFLEWRGSPDSVVGATQAAREWASGVWAQVWGDMKLTLPITPYRFHAPVEPLVGGQSPSHCSSETSLSSITSFARDEKPSERGQVLQQVLIGEQAIRRDRASLLLLAETLGHGSPAWQALQLRRITGAPVPPVFWVFRLSVDQAVWKPRAGEEPMSPFPGIPTSVASARSSGSDVSSPRTSPPIGGRRGSGRLMVPFLVSSAQAMARGAEKEVTAKGMLTAQFLHLAGEGTGSMRMSSLDLYFDVMSVLHELHSASPFAIRGGMRAPPMTVPNTYQEAVQRYSMVPSPSPEQPTSETRTAAAIVAATPPHVPIACNDAFEHFSGYDRAEMSQIADGFGGIVIGDSSGGPAAGNVVQELMDQAGANLECAWTVLHLHTSRRPTRVPAHLRLLPLFDGKSAGRASLLLVIVNILSSEGGDPAAAAAAAATVEPVRAASVRGGAPTFACSEEQGAAREGGTKQQPSLRHLGDSPGGDLGDRGRGSGGGAPSSPTTLFDGRNMDLPF
mmetsp:Transcript_33062/g.95750  ORF Transcript_33062/g.95750 Transcript_33062/m.95750 type:complete len:788 (-) Transcript_33062:14-2377(-)